MVTSCPDLCSIAKKQLLLGSTQALEQNLSIMDSTYAKPPRHADHFVHHRPPHSEAHASHNPNGATPHSSHVRGRISQPIAAACTPCAQNHSTGGTVVTLQPQILRPAADRRTPRPIRTTANAQLFHSQTKEGKLSARRSALGARRSALGARRSALKFPDLLSVKWRTWGAPWKLDSEAATTLLCSLTNKNIKLG
jgi:hypothetical protein